jgi:hypothetical protein
VLHRELIIALAARHKLPAVYFDRFFVTRVAAATRHLAAMHSKVWLRRGDRGRATEPRTLTGKCEGGKRQK